MDVIVAGIVGAVIGAGLGYGFRAWIAAKAAIAANAVKQVADKVAQP